MAFKYSDCSSAAEGGNLGFIYIDQLQKEFEDVAFSLKIDQLSQPISTASGIHIILRTG